MEAPPGQPAVPAEGENWTGQLVLVHKMGAAVWTGPLLSIEGNHLGFSFLNQVFFWRHM